MRRNKINQHYIELNKVRTQIAEIAMKSRWEISPRLKKAYLEEYDRLETDRIRQLAEEKGLFKFSLN